MNKLEARIVEHIEVNTTFGKETEFEGELEFDSSLRILGKFKGNINTSGFLIIGDGSVVEADIKADSLIIGGTVRGNVEVKNKLEILSTGKIFGDVKTSKLKIADGVVFEGKCHMIES
jgi:cytoskeletal protein CcmA (bactofilin family)